jgi:CheY-like chemotaxis protein
MLSSPNDPAPSSVPQPLVLLVEDDPDSREMYATGLQWAGFRVTSVGDGTTALTQALSLSPQIVVTDLHVPGLNGLELCRRLKTTESTASIPLIAVTGAARESDVELARAAGFDRVLIKPCLPDSLRDTIHDLLAVDASGRALHAASHPHLEPGRAESCHPVPHGSAGGQARPVSVPRMRVRSRVARHSERRQHPVRLLCAVRESMRAVLLRSPAPPPHAPPVKLWLHGSRH